MVEEGSRKGQFMVRTGSIEGVVDDGDRQYRVRQLIVENRQCT